MWTELLQTESKMSVCLRGCFGGVGVELELGRQGIPRKT